MVSKEKVSPPIESIEFKELQAGDVLAITTGVGDEAWEYYFAIDTVGQYPIGGLTGRNPDGDELEERLFELHGCGRWTTRAQNPVQRQSFAFTPNYEGIELGSFMFGRLPHSDFNGTGRLVFDNRGQEISHIALYRPRQ